MTRYEKMFLRLKKEKSAAFVPFVTLGDPNVSASVEIIATLIEAGADALELGFPYSDPIADGPAIQKASIRSLGSGTRVQNCFNIIAEIRKYYPDIPIGLLLYSNLVLAKGVDRFYCEAGEVGVDSVLVADVPIRECQKFHESALEHGVDPIYIATPNATNVVLKRVSELTHGYTYLLSRAGVTGVETEAVMPACEVVEFLLASGAPPPLLGFGVSTAEHVRQAVSAGAYGVICGSAIVNLIEQNLGDARKINASLTKFVGDMKRACSISEDEVVA